MLSFYQACHGLSHSLLRALALGLSLPSEDFFLPFHSGLNNQLRLLHYPPIAAARLESGEAARMPPHSDWGSITLLWQDNCGGLEVENPCVEGQFIAAEPVAGAVMVNVGDVMQRWSNGMVLFLNNFFFFFFYLPSPVSFLFSILSFNLLPPFFHFTLHLSN